MRRSENKTFIALERIAAAYPSRQKVLTEVTLDPPESLPAEAGLPWPTKPI